MIDYTCSDCYYFLFVYFLLCIQALKKGMTTSHPVENILYALPISPTSNETTRTHNSEKKGDIHSTTILLK